jgi:hypothetical protein
LCGQLFRNRDAKTGCDLIDGFTHDIADIARFYGENLRHGNTKMACLEVFALSETTRHGSETGYYAIRSILANTSAA